MKHLRSLAFNVCFYGWTAIVAILGLPTLALPRRAGRPVQQAWARGSMAAMRFCLGLDYEVRGRENVPPGGILVASKHQSAFDTIVFALLLRDPALVLKRELTMIPFYGWYVRKWGMIPVDRKAGPSALRNMVKTARPILAEGRPVFIFPEGTRTAPDAPPDYKPGIAALYRELGVPCVPVALNSGLYWPRRTFVKHPGRIVIEFLPPIPPGLSRGAFMTELRDRIEGATARLVAEGRAEGRAAGA